MGEIVRRSEISVKTEILTGQKTIRCLSAPKNRASMNHNDLHPDLPSAMNAPRQYASFRLLQLSAAMLFFASIPLSAGQPARTSSPTAAAQAPSPCKAGETIGFSCELRDHRVIALCASNGFDTFPGNPKDNPGHVYLTMTASTGHGASTFPAQAKDFRKHMSTGMTPAGAPYLTVATHKGTFFYVNGRADVPVSSNPQNQPAGWALPASGDDSLCTSAGHRAHFDAVFSQIPKKVSTAPDKGRDR
ncbi:hypothetical protein [Hydrogenophaga sp. RWCD_12]|uniref:hypothetical protein n=1 Tax=Hydrogenophaga sp. RWCD_12 TaxID=3391190 RepID=UPI003984B02B